MPKICYTPKTFNASSLSIIHQANDILDEYASQGFNLTLRQLYYQFVSRDIIPNKQTEYKRLGGIISDARLAGLIDWSQIVDRTRNMEQNSHWRDPQHILGICAEQYQINKWTNQPNYVEVWIEKDALVGVIEGICSRLDVPYFSCRGYTSQSEMWGAAMRLVQQAKAGKDCHIIHLGDHDPSGIDMSRDIEDRLGLFVSAHVETPFTRTVREKFSPRFPGLRVHRIALNMAQVRQYNPPPNPAKITDSRAHSYILKHGNDSWELDALEPAVMVALIEDAVTKLRDQDLWDESKAIEESHKVSLSLVRDRWTEISEGLIDDEE